MYIASAYSKGDNVTNVQMAIDIAERLVKLGYMPIIPHLNIAWHLYKNHGYKFWLDYDRELLKRCDVLLRLENESSGADNEVEDAKHMGKIIWS